MSSSFAAAVNPSALDICWSGAGDPIYQDLRTCVNKDPLKAFSNQLTVNTETNLILFVSDFSVEQRFFLLFKILESGLQTFWIFDNNEK